MVAQSYIPPGLATIIAGLKEQGRATQQTLGTAAHKDAYEVLRRVPTQTGSGPRSLANVVVETGMGDLAVPNRGASETVQAEAIGPSSSYTLTLPLATIATPDDTIRVDGRLFGITGIQRGGHFAAFATAQLEEKG